MLSYRGAGFCQALATCFVARWGHDRCCTSIGSAEMVDSMIRPLSSAWNVGNISLTPSTFAWCKHWLVTVFALKAQDGSTRMV